MSQADRQRRARQRRRSGERVYRVAVSDRVVEALAGSGRLTDEQLADPETVAAEFSDLLIQWAQHWR
jgi:hypothetical protein